MHHPASDRCWPFSEAPVAQLSVSLEKILGYSGINSEISDLAAIISNKFSRADPQNLITRVNFRPDIDTHIPGALPNSRVAEIRQNRPVGRSSIVSVGGNQADFKCSRAGLRR